MSMGRCVAALALGVGLVLGPAGMHGTQAAEEITVVIPNPSAINVFPLWVAIGEGYFEEEGLTVNVEAVDGSAPVLQRWLLGFVLRPAAACFAPVTSPPARAYNPPGQA